nr:2-oxoacid:acceptor oxidoreductase subunit alpha [Xanthomonadales bacterium]
ALDLMRVRAFPFPDSVKAFVQSHDQVFVVEQNRDAQLRTLLVNEFDLDPARLPAILHFDGTAITARFIARAIGERIRTAGPVPAKERVT